MSQAEKRLQADILPAVWARAQIAGKIAEEEEVRRELDELRKEEARQKLRDESELLHFNPKARACQSMVNTKSPRRRRSRWCHGTNEKSLSNVTDKAPNNPTPKF